MTVTVVIKNVAAISPIVTEKKVEISSDSSIQELLDKVDYSAADLSDYYEFSGRFNWNTSAFPYIISNGVIVYEPLFEETKIQNFLDTHHISNNTINITVGFPHTGGAGFPNIAEIWNNTWHVLEAISVLCTLSGVNIPQIIAKFGDYVLKKNRKPQIAFDIVYLRDCWNHFELAELLEMSCEEAKNLLVLLGYEYDRKRMQYMRGENVNSIKEKLKEIKIHDI